jgi:hypothetical protein
MYFRNQLMCGNGILIAMNIAVYFSTSIYEVFHYLATKLGLNLIDQKYVSEKNVSHSIVEAIIRCFTNN